MKNTEKDTIMVKLEVPVKYGDALKKLESWYGKRIVRKVLAEVLTREIIDRTAGILENRVCLDEDLIEAINYYAAEEHEKRKENLLKKKSTSSSA